MEKVLRLVKVNFKTILSLVAAITSFSIPAQAKPKLYSKQIVKPGEIHIALPSDQYQIWTREIDNNVGLLQLIVQMTQGAVVGGYIGLLPSFGCYSVPGDDGKPIDCFMGVPFRPNDNGACNVPYHSISSNIGSIIGGLVPLYCKLTAWSQVFDARRALTKNLEKVCQSKSYKTLGKATQNLLAHSENITKLPYKIFRGFNEFDQQKVFFKGERITSQHPLAKTLIGTVSYFPEISCAAEGKDRRIIDVMEKLEEAGMYEYPLPREFGPENKRFELNTPLAKTLKSMIRCRQDQYKNIGDLLVDLAYANDPKHSRTQYLRDLNTNNKFKKQFKSNFKEEEEKKQGKQLKRDLLQAVKSKKLKQELEQDLEQEQ